MAQVGRSGSPATGSATLDFQQQLWKMADQMRGHMDAAEYKHVALGLIFLKYISDAFEARHEELLAEGWDAEGRDEYMIELARLDKNYAHQVAQANLLEPGIWSCRCSADTRSLGT